MKPTSAAECTTAHTTLERHIKEKDVKDFPKKVPTLFDSKSFRALYFVPTFSVLCTFLALLLVISAALGIAGSQLRRSKQQLLDANAETHTLQQQLEQSRHAMAAEHEVRTSIATERHELLQRLKALQWELQTTNSSLVTRVHELASTVRRSEGQLRKHTHDRQKKDRLVSELKGKLRVADAYSTRVRSSFKELRGRMKEMLASADAILNKADEEEEQPRGTGTNGMTRGASHVSLCSPRYELILNSLVMGLLIEARLPPGVILDAGAQHGEFSCYIASAFQARPVIAIEMNAVNVARMNSSSMPSNMQVLLGGLGSHARRIAPPKILKPSFQFEDVARLPNSTSENAIDIFTLDQLFTANSRRLGFAHLDVEGSELDVLLGAHHVLSRDRPVFTVEVHVHLSPHKTAALLQLIASHGYTTFLIEEVCGGRYDCRNLLNIPKDRSASFVGSPMLNTLTASQRLVEVSADTIAGHAYPCCKRGGECCLLLRNCCSQQAVTDWLNIHMVTFNWSESRPFDGHDTGRGRVPSLFAPPFDIFRHQHKFLWPGPSIQS